ncbi:MAG TPA: adenylate/guanylate cyclase domain-containing protein, partial [Saprospiraceae bacterium]|nr:adenylate/guanylate cyclase domain-containing protein [Saprospiraceae bacterium]
MTLTDDLKSEVKAIFKDSWEVTPGRVVPSPSSIGLGNKAIEFDFATILYADLDGSTAMVDGKSWQFSSEIYKTYLHCAAKIIKDQDGVITAYDGDRIMAVFLGDRKNSRAALSALKINGAVKNIINPAIKSQYPESTFMVRHVIGIDTSKVRVARTGVRGDNDLVWVGRAANYAAKLTALPSDYPVWITADVYNALASDVKQYQG